MSLSETLQESFGLTPLEAMSSALPVVVSDWSGYKETVIHGATGFRITTRWMPCDQHISLLSPIMPWQMDHFHLSQSVAIDIEELIHYLDILIEQPDLRSKMGETARQHVLNHFAWKCVIMRYHSLWQELAEIASSLPQNIPAEQSLNCPRYYRNFEHFATQCLDGSEYLELTEMGRHVARSPQQLPLYSELQLTIHKSSLATILRYVGLANSKGYMLSINDIANGVTKKYNVAPSNVFAHVMWLLKYGMLRIQPGIEIEKTNSVS